MDMIFISSSSLAIHFLKEIVSSSDMRTFYSMKDSY